MTENRINRILIMMSDREREITDRKALGLHMNRAAYIRHILYQAWERKDREKEARETREQMIRKGGLDGYTQ